MLKYLDFYRQVGMRLPQSLVSPKPVVVRSLPLDAVLHHMPTSDVSIHPDLTHPWFKDYASKVVMMEFPTEYLGTTVGTFRTKKATAQMLMADYFRNHKRHRLTANVGAFTKDRSQLSVVNYGLLRQTHSYPEVAISRLHEWTNENRTMWMRIGQLAETTDRHHLLIVDLPEQLTAFRMLEMFRDQDLTLSATKVFDSPEKLFLLELYRWLDAGDTLDKDGKVIAGAGRQRSLLNNVRIQDLKKVTLLWKTRDGFANVMNLGYLNSWIRHQPNQTDQTRVTTRPSTDVRKMFYRFMSTLYQTVAEPTLVEPDVPAAPGEETDAVQDAVNPMLVDVVKTQVPGKIDPKKSVADAEPVGEGEPESLDMDAILGEIDEEIRISDSVQPDIDLNSVEIEDVPDNFEAVMARIEKRPTLEEELKARLSTLAEKGALTAPQYRKLEQEIAEAAKKPDPYGTFGTAVEAANLTAEDLAIDREKTKLHVSEYVNDPSMQYSSLVALQREYIQNTLRRHIVSMVNGVQRGKVIVKDHTVETEATIEGAFEVHTVTLVPLEGQPSRHQMRIPVIDKEGTYVAGGNKYVLRAQRFDLPIRKIDGNTVGLTSYYGKTFVRRNEKQANSSIAWVLKQIVARSVEDKPIVSALAPANVFDHDFDAPYLYSALSEHYKGFKIRQYQFVFARKDIEALGMDLKSIEQKGMRVCGYTPEKRPIVIHVNNRFTVLTATGQHEELGDIYDLLQLDQSKSPVDFAEIRIFKAGIPVGVALGYYIGIRNLLKLIKATHRWVEGRKQKNLQPHEYAIPFADGSLVLDRRQIHATLLLGGFAEIEKTTKQFPFAEFSKPDVYFNVMQGLGLNAMYLKELDCYDDMFVDPITLQVLEKMGEPTTFQGLLLRSVELLLKYTHPASQDVNYQRFRGYERIAGAMYEQLTKAIRQHRMGSTGGRGKVNMSTFAVWQTIMKDSAAKGVEEINPIQNLKEREIVTYVGNGGRDKGGMNKASRAFTKSDFGVMSEGSVDSSDVGINAFLSVDPAFDNVLGIPTKDRKNNPANLLSSSAMLAPAVTRDDPKRAVFVGIQESHTVAAKGYQQLPIRTGYDTVVASRVGAMFASVADFDGKVVKVTDTGMIIESADGKRQGVPLGRHYGKAEGSNYPHDLVPHVKEGDKVVKGQVVAYNSRFFQPDLLDPRFVSVLRGRLVTVAFQEVAETHEDSVAISQALANDFEVTNTKIKSVVVKFNQRIRNEVKVGSTVQPGASLMFIEDEITSSTDAFDEDSLRLLQDLSAQVPRSDILGTVDKIEVIYHGDKQDMSASLRALADKSDRAMSESCRSQGKPVIIGQVGDSYRVSGKPLMLDHAEIRVYITQDLKMGIADKGVLGNQLKCTVGEVMPYVLTTESGDQVDLKFSFLSVAARIVESAMIIGTGCTVLKAASQHVVKVYEGK